MHQAGGAHQILLPAAPLFVPQRTLTMIFILLLSLLSLLAATTGTLSFTPAAISCSVTAEGSYTITVGGTLYFTSGPTYFRADGRTFSTLDQSLVLAGPPTPPTPGSSTLGPYLRQDLVWKGAGGHTFYTAIEVYAALGVVVFEQSFPATLNGTSASPSPAAGEEVTSAFPSFALDPSDQTRGVIGWGGRFLEGSHASAWGKVGTTGLPSAGQHGGPMVLFDGALSTAVAVSSLNNHAIATSSLDGVGGTLSYGLLGSVTSIPAGFVLRTIVAATVGGPSEGTLRWGDLVRTSHGLPSPRPYDMTLQFLGYATDNGSYYYYNTEKDNVTGKAMSYEDTLLGVVADAQARGIPLRYLLLDSWWYTKGQGGGVVEWNATIQAFPHGLPWFHRQVDMPFHMHNRMWAAENVYAKQNGGGYDFLVEEENHLAIPLTQVFWDDLLRNASTKYGGVVYNQDWLFTEAEGLNATRESATLVGQWLTQMATAAGNAGMTIQYCMSLGRFVMMAAQLPALTQLRAGDDYGPGQTATCSFPYCVYYIGTSSLLAWALDLAPSKDGFWSTEYQPGNPYHNATEPYSAMEAAIAALSTAPVQVGDRIGYTNTTLVHALCMEKSGRLLQPSRPATAIDACFAGAAFSTPPTASNPGNLPIQSSHTLLGGVAYAHILVIGLQGAFELTPTHLPLDITGGLGYVVYKGWWREGNGHFAQCADFGASPSSPLALPSTPLPTDWALYHAAPIYGGGVKLALLGEAGKLVPVSVARFLALTPLPNAENATSLVVEVQGDVGEAVALSFGVGDGKGGWRVVEALPCTLGSGGKASVTVDASGDTVCG